MSEIKPIGPGRRRRRELAFSVRSAVVADVGAVAELCGQGGFEVTAAEVAERLVQIAQLAGGSVLVACGTDGRLLGWLHVAPHYSLCLPPQAEIVGLLVERASRGLRIGSALLGAAELWARERRLGFLRVHDNALREDAVLFFSDRGFARHDAQQALGKALA